MVNTATILLIVACFFIGYVLLSFYFSVRPIRFTSVRTPSELGLLYEDVQFSTQDNLTLAGWLISSDPQRPTVVVGHGYPFDKGNILPLVSFLYPAHNLLVFDFRYFGKSQGAYTTGGALEVRDVHAAAAFLKKRGYNPPFGAVGFSLGAATFLLANNPDITAVVADSSYDTMDRMIRDLYAVFPGPLKEPFVVLTKWLAKALLGVDADSVNPVDAVKKSKAAILLIHGSADWQIPVSASEALKESAKGKNVEIWIVSGAGHGQSHARKPAVYEQKVLAFFEKNLKHSSKS